MFKKKYSEGTHPAYYEAELTEEQVQEIIDTNYKVNGLIVEKATPLSIDALEGGFQRQDYPRIKKKLFSRKKNIDKRDEIDRVQEHANREGLTYVNWHYGRGITSVDVGYRRAFAGKGYSDRGIEELIEDEIALDSDIPNIDSGKRHFKFDDLERFYLCEIELNDGTTRLLYGVLEPAMRKDKKSEPLYDLKIWNDKFVSGLIPELSNYQKKKKKDEQGKVGTSKHNTENKKDNESDKVGTSSDSKPEDKDEPNI